MKFLAHKYGFGRIFGALSLTSKYARKRQMSSNPERKQRGKQNDNSERYKQRKSDIKDHAELHNT